MNERKGFVHVCGGGIIEIRGGLKRVRVIIIRKLFFQCHIIDNNFIN